MKILVSILKNIYSYTMRFLLWIKSLEINKWSEQNLWLLRFIEVIAIIVGVLFATYSMYQVKTQIIQTWDQIDQIQQQIDLWNSGLNLTLEQNKIANNTYEKWKRFEEIKLLQEVSQYFETEPNRSILEDMRIRSENMSTYWDIAIKDLLDKFEYLAWLIEENGFKDNDIRVNFAGSIEIICESNFVTWPQWIMNTYAPWGYWGVKKLCRKRWWQK